MAKIQMLGLFYQPETAADSMDRLRELGVTDDEITVISGIPYKAEMLGRPKPKGNVGRVALFGAVIGVALGLFLSVGVFLLYPIQVGGQPIVPIPPTLIVIFETTMLCTMWAAFFGMMGENRFPSFKRQIYDPRITEGYIGVAVDVGEVLAVRAEEAFKAAGAQDVVRGSQGEKHDAKRTRFLAIGAAATVGLIVLTGLFVYDVIKINWPTQMAEQESIAYTQGPRLAAPAEAIPVQGPVLISGQPATAPVPATPESIARGKALFDITCAVCHGPAGDGKSMLAGFFNPRPADLTGDVVKGLSDNQIYLVITQGFGIMPPQAESLDREERWDVINYVRSLQQ